MKKILNILFICLILVGCGTKNQGVTYVLPTEGENRVELDETNQAKIQNLYNVLLLEENDLKALDVDLNSLSDYLVDTSGESISLEGITFIEVVATWCTYCKDQAKVNNPILIKENSDYTFIQLFTEQEESIEDYYKELETEIPSNDNFHIVEKNDELVNAIDEKIDLEYFPTNLVLVDGVVKLMFSGECGSDVMTLIKKYLKDPVENVQLTEIIVRNSENVKADIGEENVAKLQALEDEGNYATVDVAINNMGKSIANIPYVNPVVLFVNYFENTEFNDLVKVFKEKNPDVDVILWTQDVENEEELPTLENVTQYTSDTIPESIRDGLTGEVLPVAFYFENGVCTGAISSPSALSTLNEGLELFIGENSIARIK